MFGFNDFSVTEKKWNAPDPCDSNQSEDNSADSGALPSEGPGHEVEREDTNAAPVQSADNDKQ